MRIEASQAPPNADRQLSLSAFGGLVNRSPLTGNIPSTSSSELGSTTQPLLPSCASSAALLSKMTWRS
jgi:hypothetical protein